MSLLQCLLTHRTKIVTTTITAAALYTIYRYTRRARAMSTRIPPSSIYLPVTTIQPKLSAAYLELELPHPSLLHTYKSHHFQAITKAIEKTERELLIGFNTDPLQFSTAELNTLLGDYYNHISSISLPRYGLLYRCTILFPIPDPNCSAVERMRQNVALIADIQAVFEDQSKKIVNEMNAYRIQQSLPTLTHLPIQPVKLALSVASSTHSPTPSLQQFSDVVIGGTFDNIHLGHKILLTMSVLLAQRSLVIGLTADEMLVNKKHASQLDPWLIRRDLLHSFLHLLNPTLIVDIVPLHDMYGPSGDRDYLKAIVVSEETEKGGALVNIKRAENGVSALEVIVVKLVQSSSSEKISSTAIRAHKLALIAEREVRLERQWKELCASLSVHPARTSYWWSLLHSRYSESHRSYHTLTHIDTMLNLLFQSSHLAVNRSNIELSIWFHDVIYELFTGVKQKGGSNEDQSAQLFLKFAEETNLSASSIDLINAYILSTKSHKPILADDVDLQLFLDIDLAVLGFDRESYYLYTRSIRTEYRNLPEPDYLTGRVRVLQSLLGKQQLYETREFQSCESTARYNVKCEIEKLQATKLSGLGSQSGAGSGSVASSQRQPGSDNGSKL